MASSNFKIPRLFVSEFTVDERAPFHRHLNRLEVEIGREDYTQLKKVERLEKSPSGQTFNAMEEITGRLLKNTQNSYNRTLLERLGAQIYLDHNAYAVYYRLPDKTIRFTPVWRQQVLERFFPEPPEMDSGWRPCGYSLGAFECRFIPDVAGGVLLLRQADRRTAELPVLTATHGPFDPHTLDVALYFLHTGRGSAAIINLGFAGREPLADENLEQLKSWGIPLNPSNIDVIYPYVDDHGHLFCYKVEEGLSRYLHLLGEPVPELIIDIHGCVGMHPEDRRLVVGLGGMPPFPKIERLGRLQNRSGILHLAPQPRLQQGLGLLRHLSREIYVQLCDQPHQGYHFLVLGGLQLMGSALDTRQAVKSLLSKEERTYLPAEDIRWLPGAGANALQRLEAAKVDSDLLCLHVEIPTVVRHRMALKLKELEIGLSLDASAL